MILCAEESASCWAPASAVEMHLAQDRALSPTRKANARADLFSRRELLVEHFIHFDVNMSKDITGIGVFIHFDSGG